MITCSGAASQHQAGRIRVSLRVRVQVRVRLRVRLGEVGQEQVGQEVRHRAVRERGAQPELQRHLDACGPGTAAGLVRGGACGRPGLVLGDATPRGSWAALQGPAAQPAPKRPQLSSQAQRAAVCFLLIGVEMKAGSESALPSSRPPISRPAPTQNTCRRTGGSTISWTVTTSRTWIATRAVEGVRLEDGRMAAAWLCCMWPQG